MYRSVRGSCFRERGGVRIRQRNLGASSPSYRSRPAAFPASERFAASGGVRRPASLDPLRSVGQRHGIAVVRLTRTRRSAKGLELPKAVERENVSHAEVASGRLPLKADCRSIRECRVRCDRPVVTPLESAAAAGIRCTCRSLFGVCWLCRSASAASRRAR
jgi:hypothetical protein